MPEHQRGVGQSRRPSGATFVLLERQEGPKSGGKSVNLVYEPHRMLRRCTGSGGLLITGLHLLHRDVNGLRLGCVFAHFSEMGGKPVIKQEFRIGRFECEHPKCLWRDNLAADRFVEECAHRIKYRIASIVEIVLQLYSRDDHLLYRDPCADGGNYGDRKRLQCLNPQRQHPLCPLDTGQPIDNFCCALEGGTRLGEVAGLSRFKEPAEHATRVR